jgi:hypothetical protein
VAVSLHRGESSFLARILGLGLPQPLDHFSGVTSGLPAAFVRFVLRISGAAQQETTAGGTVLVGNQLYYPALGRILSRPAADPVEGVSTNVRLMMARSSRGGGLLETLKHGFTDLGTMAGIASFVVAAGGLLVGTVGCPPCSGIVLAESVVFRSEPGSPPRLLNVSSMGAGSTPRMERD